MTRWQVACDTCDASAWIGPGDDALDAWCEACQSAQSLAPEAAALAGALRCPRCGELLTTGAPRFVEMLGERQHLIVVLAAWAGDPAPLHAILPERPRFLSDLAPPAPHADDPPAVRELLHAVAAGAWHHAAELTPAALAATTPEAAARVHAARAIAAERANEPRAAEEAWSAALAVADDPRARLARGALRARRGDWAAAQGDLERAGASREARWNRAALAMSEAVARTPGLPDAGVIERARAEAGTWSEYWSDPSIGRLLFGLLVERALARRALARRARSRRAPDASSSPDEDVLRAAATLLEHDTFWDRALVLHGFAALFMERDTAAVAAPLADACLAVMFDQPALRGPAFATDAETLRSAQDAWRAGEPRRAIERMMPVGALTDLGRYRIPCLACGRGSVGVAAIEEAGP